MTEELFIQLLHAGCGHCLRCLVGCLLERWRHCVPLQKGVRREKNLDPLPSELCHLYHKFPGFPGLAVCALRSTSCLYVNRDSWRQEGAPAGLCSREELTGHLVSRLLLAIWWAGVGKEPGGQAGLGYVWRCSWAAHVDTPGLPLPCELLGTGVGP